MHAHFDGVWTLPTAENRVKMSPGALLTKACAFIEIVK